MVCVCVCVRAGGGGEFSLSYKRLLHFVTLRSYIVVGFLQMTFKRGNFTDLKALIPAESTDFSRPILSTSKVEMSIVSKCR